MKVNDIIQEVSYKDIYPSAFEEFKQKWGTRPGKKYYVQFSIKDNALDRTSFLNPDHSDPVGVYGYPLAYVVKHPADIWYGAGAKYLRVLEKTSNKVLDLQTEFNSMGDVHDMWKRVGFSPANFRRMENLIVDQFEHRIGGRKKFAKIFFQGIQYDFDKNEVRSGVEQTALIRRAGYNVIEDRATSPENAIVNEREPEQVIFLDRSAFRVVEVYNLRGGVPSDKLPGLTAPDPSASVIERPLAAKIARAMDSRLASGPLGSSLGNLYWTKGGDRIKISFSYTKDYMDSTDIGKKKHRVRTDSIPKEINVELTGSRGTVKKTYAPGTLFDDVALDIGKTWLSSPEDDGWQKETMQSYVEKERQRIEKLRAEKKKKDNEKDIADFIENYGMIAQELGIDSSVDERSTELLIEWLRFIRIKKYSYPDDLDGVFTNAFEFVSKKLSGGELGRFKRSIDDFYKVIDAAGKGKKYIAEWGASILNRLVRDLEIGY